jgi:hypothetical protein
MMTKRGEIHKKIAKILAEVPIDDRNERDDLYARLRKRYAELKPLKRGMGKENRDCFEEIGEIIERLIESEARSREPRS